MARKSTGKRLRFEVFKRDGFTCRYCGAQPPDVVLVCDHLIPVAGGGLTDIANLVTACEPCNQGKSDKSITSIVPTPDADLMFLEVQQELAELRRYRSAIVERDEELEALSYSILDACSEVDSYCSIELEDIRALLAIFDAPVVFDSCTAFAARFRNADTPNNWAAYLNGICRNKQAERDR